MNDIIVTKSKVPFSQIPDALICDPTMNAVCVFIYSYLIARSGCENWRVRVKDLQNQSGVGRDRIYSALKTLIESGWIIKTIEKDNSNKFIRTIYKVQYNPFTDTPEVDSPEVENKDTYNKIKVIDNNKIKTFESWYKLYDKKTTKKKAMNYWLQKINEKDIDDILKHTKLYKDNTDKPYRKDPIRYLRDEKWLDEVMVKGESYDSKDEAMDKYYERLKENTEKLSAHKVADKIPNLLKDWKKNMGRT